jgi:hypothetical protein
MSLNVLEGFVKYRNTDSNECTIVHRIYHNGKLVTCRVTSDTLEDNTYLIEAIAINRDMLQVAAYEIINPNGKLSLREVDLYEIYISDYLYIAMADVYNVCHADNSDKNGLYTDIAIT